MLTYIHKLENTYIYERSVLPLHRWSDYRLLRYRGAGMMLLDVWISCVPSMTDADVFSSIRVDPAPREFARAHART